MYLRSCCRPTDWHGTLPSSFSSAALCRCIIGFALPEGNQRQTIRRCRQVQKQAEVRAVDAQARVVRNWVQKAAQAAVSAGAASFISVNTALAQGSVSENWNSSCLGCHAAGGNVVQAGATLKLADLQRNGVADPEAIYKLIYFGKGKMPGYGKDCAPRGKCTFARRLSDEEIHGLTDYVLEQAARGWKQ